MATTSSPIGSGDMDKWRQWRNMETRKDGGKLTKCAEKEQPSKHPSDRLCDGEERHLADIQRKWEWGGQEEIQAAPYISSKATCVSAGEKDGESGEKGMGDKPHTKYVHILILKLGRNINQL